MVNCALPLVLSGTSIFFTAPSRPISLKSAGFFSGTSSGTGSFAAASAKAPKAALPVRRGVLEHAFLNNDLAGRHIPGFACRTHKQGTRGGTSFAHLLVGIGDGGRAAGALNAEQQGSCRPADRTARASTRILRPVGVHLFGNERGEAGERPLPELNMLGEHRDNIVRTDAHESIGRETAAAPSPA